jgi:hypothetical protein
MGCWDAGIIGSRARSNIIRRTEELELDHESAVAGNGVWGSERYTLVQHSIKMKFLRYQTSPASTVVMMN